MNPIVGRHNALLVASVAGWTLHEGGRDRALRKPTSVFTKAEIPSYAPQIMERTGPARQSRRKLFTLSEVSANMLSQRQRGSLSVRVLCQVDFLLLSQTLSLPLRPFTPPFGPQRRPPVWSQAASVYCAPPVASPHSVHWAAVLTSHQCSFIRRRGPASRTLLPAAIILPSTLKKKSETNLPRQNPPSRSPFC